MTNPAATTHAHKTSAYSEKLKDPRWQRRRLEVFERDRWACRACKATDTTLHVHHLSYEKGKDPWDYDMRDLVSLCEICHDLERESRFSAEQSLLFELKQKGFLYSEISIISDMIHDMSCPEPPFKSWSLRVGSLKIQISRTDLPDGDQE